MTVIHRSGERPASPHLMGRLDVRCAGLEALGFLEVAGQFVLLSAVWAGF